MPIVFLGKENVYGIESKETGKLLGTIGLIDDPKRQNKQAHMLGYAIGEEYWGKGYTTEAAQALISARMSDTSVCAAHCILRRAPM
jgi:putative acetyltransferase